MTGGEPKRSRAKAKPPPGVQRVTTPWRETHQKQLAGLRELLEVVLVREVMKQPVSCPLYAGLDAIEALLLDTDAQSAVVIDQQGRLQGILTKTDLVRRHFSAAEPAAGDLDEINGKIDGEVAEELDGELGEWGFHKERTQAPLTAAELMTPGAATARADNTLREVLRIIELEQVFCLPVLAAVDDPTVVGMISAREVVDWLGRCAGAGRRIREVVS